MREQHVEPSESVRMHFDLGAKQSLAIHWGTFSLTDESLDEPPIALASALAGALSEPGAQPAHATSAREIFVTLAVGATLKLARR
jgi:N-acyl-phosphatidylethanolamine-hydrolysing phospholipase D